MSLKNENQNSVHVDIVKYILKTWNAYRFIHADIVKYTFKTWDACRFIRLQKGSTHFL